MRSVRNKFLLSPNRSQFLRASYYCGWAIFLAAFVAIGGRELWMGARGNFLAPRPYASIDSYLEELLEISNASETCARALARISGPREVVFLCPGRNARADFVYDLLTYLSWPQQFQKVEIDRLDLEQWVQSIDKGSTSALIFFSVPPPSEFTQGWRLGPHLVIVPLDQP
jgi:hypothetical protein